MEPPYLEVTSPADPRVADFVALTDVELRRRTEPAAGLFVAEGDKVIRRAVAAGYQVRAFLLSPRWADGLADVVALTGAPAYVAAEDVLTAVTGYPVHRGALASCARRQLPDLAELLAPVQRVAVLEDLTDPTNVGLVFRSAAALGIDAVLLSPRCADPLYRRAVKTSMGAVLTLPYTRLPSWYDGLDQLRAAGFEVLALTPDPTDEPLDLRHPATADRVAVVLGSEGAGMSPRWLRAADRRVRIPQRRDVDSLNVAAAAAIVFAALAPETLA